MMSRPVIASRVRRGNRSVDSRLTPGAIRSKILEAAESRRHGKTICPSEVARALWPADWREHVEEVRQSAEQLCHQELLLASQRGVPVQISEAVGPIRLSAREFDAPAIPFPGRLGLCCLFSQEPIKFRTTTATHLARLSRPDQLRKLSELCLHNARSLRSTLRFCERNGIGAFRIASTFFPVSTHPQVGYQLEDLPESITIMGLLEECRTFAAANGIRTSFHPDQFVVLNSPRRAVVESSLKELVAQAELAELVGADVINIHGGGAYGDKTTALMALTQEIERLPEKVRTRLTLENDDRVFTPSDLLPVCRATGIPLVYDVHHHRCCPDGLSVSAATEQALTTWNREPLFHLSSPINGWSGSHPQRHHDEIDPRDFPRSWLNLPITIDVEAKSKEVAILKLQSHLKIAGKINPPSERKGNAK